MVALIVCCRGSNLYSKLPIYRQFWLHKTYKKQLLVACDICRRYSGLKSVAETYLLPYKDTLLKKKTLFGQKAFNLYNTKLFNSNFTLSASLCSVWRTSVKYVKFSGSYIVPLLWNKRNISHSNYICIRSHYTLMAAYSVMLLTCKYFNCHRRTIVERASQVIRSNPPWRILFFGTDNFAIATLKALNENRICQSSRLVETLEVVSNRGQTPVRKYSEEVGLRVYDWPFKSVINHYDVGVVISFGHLIPDSIIHQFPYGILNVHPSLLPRWRGASPIIHTILNGDMETGISVMEIRPRHFDIGPLLMQRKYPVSDRMTTFGLADILAPSGGQLLLKCLENLPTLENYEVEQTNRGVTYAHKIVPAMANIDWVNQTCVDIDHQYRAIHEIYPLRSSWNGHTVKLLNMIHPKDLSVSHVESVLNIFWHCDIDDLLPGMPVFDKEENCLLIRCKDGMVGFTHIIIKKKMNAQAFYNGYMSNSQHQGICFESIPNHLNKDIFREKTLVYSEHQHNRSM
ncbi:hypothetical protein CHS0354_013673 [Potamilus streckersoni]|uniref:Methionyl-tRNA formyltransferase, mitochondrial n=1 Tax=Potamilus streckersoni TaxID=2493646 RepID=A0AAE0VUI2_9BIVA|nr:hypothetical protein CHS0354_013673 [Potamilus streckersoni]